MNTQGEIRTFKTQEEAIAAGFSIPVSQDELTNSQARRLKENNQPVVKAADTRSHLAKKRKKFRCVEHEKEQAEDRRKIASKKRAKMQKKSKKGNR